MTEPNGNLGDALSALARKRAEMAEIEATYKKLYKERKALTEAVRGIALADYEQRKELKPLEGLQIEMHKVVEGADSPAMLDWCMHKAQNLIGVEQKEAIKQVKHLIAKGAPLKLSYQPRVKIASDLSKWEDV